IRVAKDRPQASPTSSDSFIKERLGNEYKPPGTQSALHHSIRSQASSDSFGPFGSCAGLLSCLQPQIRIRRAQSGISSNAASGYVRSHPAIRVIDRSWSLSAHLAIRRNGRGLSIRRSRVCIVHTDDRYSPGLAEAISRLASAAVDYLDEYGARVRRSARASCLAAHDLRMVAETSEAGAKGGLEANAHIANWSG